MSYVYFVVPDLGYAGHARQVSLLAPGLQCIDCTAGAYSLAGDGPFGQSLRANQVPVDHKMGHTARDLRMWLALRWLIPHPGQGTVHAFGLGVLRRLVIATLGTRLPRIVLSLTGHERLKRFDHWCLGRVARILVPHNAAAAALSQQRIAESTLAVVPPAVAETPPQPDRSSFCNAYGLPSDASIVMTAGWMYTRESLFDAVWAFEFLRYVDEKVHLVVIGDGPGRKRMEAAARALAPDGTRVRFLGARPDLPSILGFAHLVLVPQLVGGANVALEAMAAGRAVIAANTPDLAAVIRDGETGVLAPTRNAPELAFAMRQLLVNPEDRFRLGSAAQLYVSEFHSVERIARALQTVYRN
jgi:glycosyltransferase involved in cell wall biosynthesis